MAGRPAASKITTLGPSGIAAAGLVGSGGLGVALPIASAKRSRLLPEVFDDCSEVGRRLSPRDRAIMREVSEGCCSKPLGDGRYC